MSPENCPICSDPARPRFGDTQRGVQYTVHHCAECDLLFPSPRPSVAEAAEHYGQVYSDEYYASPTPEVYGYPAYVEQDHLTKLTFERRVKHIRRYLPGPPARVFEVGCASGAFLEVMEDRGHDVAGLEVCSRMARIAAERLQRGTVICKTTEEIDTPPLNPVGILAAWDVIEHLVDPLAALKRWCGWMADGGVLILETQNWRALTARLFGRRWVHFKHCEHLYHFTPQFLRSALEGLGLSVVRVSATGSGKYVTREFLANRLQRVSPLLAGPVGLWSRLRGPQGLIWLEPRDEFVLVAVKE